MSQIDLISQVQQDTQQRNATQPHSNQGQAQAAGQTSKPSGRDSGTNIASSKPDGTDLQLDKYRAYFAVDEDKNVVIRIADAAGKVVRQLPPEAVLKGNQILNDTFEKIFDAKA